MRVCAMLYELDQPKAGEYNSLVRWRLWSMARRYTPLHGSRWMRTGRGSFFPGLEEDRAMLKAAREELARRKAKGLEE